MKTFVKWEDFGHRLLGTTRRVFEGMSVRGQAPKLVRISPQGPAYYLAEDIEFWISRAFASVAGEVA